MGDAPELVSFLPRGVRQRRPAHETATCAALTFELRNSFFFVKKGPSGGGNRDSEILKSTLIRYNKYTDFQNVCAIELV